MSAPAHVAQMRGLSEGQIETSQFEAITSALDRRARSIRGCWTRAAADDLHLSGRVTVAINIGASGATKAEIVASTVEDAVLTSCLETLWDGSEWPSSFAEGDRIELPPFEFVAPSSQYVVGLADVPSLVTQGGKLRARPLLRRANTGNGEASLTVVTASPGLRQEFHTHGSAELLFVLSGEGSLVGVGSGVGTEQLLVPGSGAFVAPGVIHKIAQRGALPLEFVQFFAPLSPGSSDSIPVEKELPKKGPHALVRQVRKAKRDSIWGGNAEVRVVLSSPGAENYSVYLGALTAQGGAMMPLHQHAKSSEYLFVIEGFAKMRIAGREMLAGPGDGVQIPPGVLHRAEIVGSEAFKALQFFAPAGPALRSNGETGASLGGP